MDSVLIFLLMGGVAAVVLLLVWQHQRARQEAMQRLADELGWIFYPEGVPKEDNGDFFATLLGTLTSPGGDARYRSFGVFSRGRDRRAYNTLQGSLLLSAAGEPRPFPALAGDFRYTTGSGKNKSTHRFSYLIVELPFGPAPETIVRPEGFFDQIAGFVGFDDIDFESAQFSDAFHVKGSDKRFAYDLCDARMMEFLMASRPQMFEIDRFHLCVSAGRGCWDPEEFKTRILWVAQFLEHWPRHLVDRLAPREGAGQLAATWGAAQ